MAYERDISLGPITQEDVMRAMRPDGTVEISLYDGSGRWYDSDRPLEYCLVPTEWALSAGYGEPYHVQAVGLDGLASFLEEEIGIIR